MHKVFILLSLIATACRGEVSTNDELRLYFRSQTDASLYGDPGTLHRLEFTFHNKGPPGEFKAKQTSEHETFVGSYDDDVFFLNQNRVHGVVIKDLIVPGSAGGDGTKIPLTVTVERTAGGDEDSQQEVSKTVLFTVGNLPEDASSPQITEISYPKRCPGFVEGTNSDDADDCIEDRWKVQFRVRDPTTGLWTVESRVAGRESASYPSLFSYSDYVVGDTNDEVVAEAEVSCCVNSVLFKAVDLAGNEVEVESSKGDSPTGKATAANAASCLTVALAFFCAKYF